MDDVLAILICGADGCTLETDPNGLIVDVLVHDLVRSMPGYPDRISDISGAPGAIMYKSHSAMVWGTPEEIDRLCRRDLEVVEVAILKAKFGDRFEWHEDFYDHDTFEALQPKGRTPL